MLFEKIRVKIQVLLTREKDVITAHGLEIDYTAQSNWWHGATIEFSSGLGRTFAAHTKQYGTLQYVLKPAPENVWKEFFLLAESGKLEFYETSNSENGLFQYLFWVKND